MKKYKGLLVLLVLATIIGGVYAVWTYAEGGVASVDHTVGIGIEAKATTGTKGTISISGTNEFLVTLDQLDSEHGDHHAKMTLTGGPLTVTFTPDTAGNANPDVIAHGIKMQWHITGPEGLVDSDNNTAFSVDSGCQDVAIYSDPAPEEGKYLTKNTDGSFSFQITADDITTLGLITVNNSFELPTSADYDAFVAKLGTGDTAKKFTITVEEYTPTPEP